MISMFILMSMLLKIVVKNGLIWFIFIKVGICFVKIDIVVMEMKVLNVNCLLICVYVNV